MSTETTDTTTDTTSEATEAEETTQEAQKTAQEPQEPEEPSEDTNPNKEAAKYRRKLRETEAERDQLRSQLETMQRAEAERIAGEVVANPTGLWAAGTNVADLLDKEGRVDAQKVRDAAKHAAEQLGLAPSRRHGGYASLQGKHPDRPAKGNGFESAFAPPKP